MPKQSIRSLKSQTFTRQLDRVRGECWGYSGRTDDDGYPIVPHEGKNWRGNRLMWALAHGEPAPKDKCVCHHCDNPPCIRPSHLWLGTHAENVEDKMRKGRNGKGYAGKKHSKEFKTRLSQSWKGVAKSQEHKDKISAALKKYRSLPNAHEVF